MQISAASQIPVDLQLILIRHREANQILLLVPRAAPQAGALWTVSLIRHADSFYDSPSGTASAVGVTGGLAATSASLARFSAINCFAD
jgi:hypothetical protein